MKGAMAFAFLSLAHLCVSAAQTRSAMLAHQKNGITVSAIAPYGKQRGPDQEDIENGKPKLVRTWIGSHDEQAVVKRIVSYRCNGDKIGFREMEAPQ